MTNPAQPPLMITWKLDVVAANIVLEALGKLPFERVAALAHYCKQTADAQVAEQEAARAKTTAAPATEPAKA